MFPDFGSALAATLAPLTMLLLIGPIDRVGAAEPPEVISPPAAVSDPKEIQEREELYELLLNLADTIDQIDRNYVDQISRREIIEAAIEGVIRKLDPYSSYIPPAELQAFKVGVESTFGGVGIQLGSRNGQLQVISPMVGTPAYHAGILAGDRLTQINGESTKDLSVSQATDLLQGPPESKVVVTVVHRANQSSETIELTRERIKVDTVLGDRRQSNGRWQFLFDVDYGIGYIRVTSFGRETVAELRQALQELDRQDAQALVLDLRFNSGGLLRGAIEVADLFLDEGRIVSTRGRNIREQSWDATAPGTWRDLPMVVLVNQFTASASEIVAAALQDHHRAVVVGERTFGKASIQNIVELENGRSALKLTTGSYERPNGQSIHRFPDAEQWGVVPNAGFEVRLSSSRLSSLMRDRRRRDQQASEATLAVLVDQQLDRAIGHLRQTIAKSQARQTP